MTRARPRLAVRRSSSAPARFERVAWVVLAVLACVLAHEASYQVMYRGTVSYRATMSLLGHDGYWLGLTVAVGVATSALAGVVAVQLRRLHRDAASTPALAADERPGAMAYLRLVGATWLRLALLAALLFTVQENLEAVAAGLPLRGLDVILGHALLPLLALLTTTLLMSLAVALVRWRRRVLLGRLAARAGTWSRSPRRPPVSTRPLLGFRPADSWESRAPPKVATTVAL